MNANKVLSSISLILFTFDVKVFGLNNLILQ